MQYEEYKAFMFSQIYKPESIMRLVKIPETVLKYRCFERYENGVKKEDNYWKESFL